MIAAETATQLQEQQGHAQSLQSQLSQTQQALQDLKRHQAAAQQKAVAREASLHSALRAKDSELRDIQVALASSQAMAAAGQSELTSLQEQVTNLQAKLNKAEDAHNTLQQLQADSQQEAGAHASSLTAAVEAKALELDQVAASLSGKDAELLQLTASLKEAQDQAAALQTALTEQQSSSKSQEAKLNKAQLAFKKLKRQHEDFQQTASAKEAELVNAGQARDAELQQAAQAAAAQAATLQELTTAQQASVDDSVSLKTALQELTGQHEVLQQQLVDQQQAYDELKLQHVSAQANMFGTEADSAADIKAMRCELSQLRETVAQKEASLEELTALLRSSERQMSQLQSASEAANQSLHSEQHQADEQVISAEPDLIDVPGMARSDGPASQPGAVGSANQGAGVLPAEQKSRGTPITDKGSTASTSVNQTQKQKLLGKAEKQHNQLKHEHSTLSKQYQAATAKLAEADKALIEIELMDARLHELEASLTERDVVIHHLRLELAKQTATPRADQSTSTDAVMPDALVELQCSDVYAKPVTATKVSHLTASGNSRSFATSDRSISSLQNLPLKQASLADAQEDESDVESNPSSSPVAAGTSAGSLSMPEGSVNNPLADEPEHYDHQTPAGMFPLSPQLSSHTVNGDKEGDAESNGKFGVPASGGVVAGQKPVTAALSAPEASAIASSRTMQYGTNTKVCMSSYTSVNASVTSAASA